MPRVSTIVAAALLWLLSAAVDAQGVSTSGIRGSVSVEPGQHTVARVRVSRDATGFAVEIHAMAGRFLIEVGDGHTLVSFGNGGGVKEYDAAGNVVWRLTGNPGYVFRAQRIRSLYKPGVGDPR